MLKEKEFRREAILTVNETISVIRQFNRRCLEKIWVQQHMQPPKKLPYVNFNVCILKMSFYDSVVLLETDNGALEIIIAPYLDELVSCRISYMKHETFGGWWIEFNNLRFIFQCSYEHVLETIEDERNVQRQSGEKDKWNNRLFHAICLGEKLENRSPTTDMY